MKTILLSISLLMLSGCSFPLNSTEKDHLIETSAKFCSCHGGIEKMSFYKHIKEVLVTCIDSRWTTFGLEDIVKKECK